MRRVVQSVVAIAGLLALSAAPAVAAPILTGTSVTVALRDTGFGSDLQDIVTVGAGNEIAEGDGSNIGMGAMLDGEYVNVFDLGVEFQLFGGGAPQGTPNYLLTGYGVDARYELTNLFAPGVARITGVTALLTNVVGVVVGPAGEVRFDDHSVTLYVDTLGILQSAQNLGRVRLTFTVQDLGSGPGPSSVPEPATMTLFGVGLSALAARLSRQRAAALRAGSTE